MTSRTNGGRAAAAPVIEDVEELLTVAGDHTHKFWFYRRGESPVPSYLGSVPVVECRAPGVREYVRTRWGGGTFQCKLRHVNGTWGQSRSFTIEGDAIVSRHEDERTSSSSSSNSTSSSERRPPGWVEQIVLPIGSTIATALVTLIAKKLIDKPETDPLLLKLVEQMHRASKGGDVDPIELQRLVLEAERRGEDRGKQLGELTVRASSRGNGGGDAGGVGGAIRELAPVVTRMLDDAAERRRAQPPAHVVELRRTATGGRAPAPSPTPVEDSVSSSIPAWLAPFSSLRPMLLRLADSGKRAGPYADMVIDRLEDDEQLLAELVRAHQGGRLEADIFAAVPELQETPERRAFVAEFLAAVGESLLEMTQPDDDAAPAARGDE